VKKAVLAVAFLVSAIQLSAQEVGSPSAFEVASIKRNVSGDPGRGRTEPGGRFTATSAPVIQLIRLAYDNLAPDRILNVPEWVMSERYDVIAKAPEGTPPRTMGLLMRSLLQDRFAFEAHFETREMPIYELVLARQDGKLGPNLQQASCDCTKNTLEQECRPGAPVPSFPEFDGMTCMQLGAQVKGLFEVTRY
jgi:uncharacterized protein (TIGR03435 family)